MHSDDLRNDFWSFDRVNIELRIKLTIVHNAVPTSAICLKTPNKLYSLSPKSESSSTNLEQCSIYQAILRQS